MRAMTPEVNEEVLRELADLSREHRGSMMVRSKCQPAFMRVVHERDPSSPLLHYPTGCPCGVQYCRITPDGKLTPCPYLPEIAGDLRRESFGSIWRNSELLTKVRSGALAGKCGNCEFRAVCGGCRARAFADTGDVMASDGSCGYEPSGNIDVIRPKGDTYGQRADAQLPWTAAARDRMAAIPSFVRGVVMGRVETWAIRHGHGVITVQLLDEVRSAMPVDFSKRLPHFLRRGNKS